MATSMLTEDYQCGYCLQDFNSMTDPRKLPCHHVFCLSCLQGDFRDAEGINCLICKNNYRTLSLEDLPKASINSAADKSPNGKVFVCNKTGCDKTAVSYCVMCEEKICDSHQQIHNEYFADCHKVLPFKEYAERSKDVRRPKCQLHEEVLGQACKVCDKLFCAFCDLKENCRDANPHDFHRFCEIEAEITFHYTGLTELLLAKLTEICKLQKQTWYALEEEESACEAMTLKINKIRDEQIQIIVKESEELKSQVDDYLLDIRDQVELYSAELVTNKEVLEMQQQKLHTLMRNGHIAEKIQKKRALSQELNESLNRNFRKELRKRALIRKVAESSMPLDIVRLPSSVTYLRQQEVHSLCFSPCYNDIGDILVGTHDGLQCYNMSTMELTTIDDAGKDMTSVALHSHKLYTIHAALYGNDVVSIRPIEDMASPTTLFEFPRTGNLAARLAVSDQYVIATNPDASELFMYNTQSRLTVRKHLCVKPFSILFCTDHCLLVTGNSQLIKYTLKDGELSQVWQCNGIDHAGHIDSDSNGLIYVKRTPRKGEGGICIVSPDGQQLKTIADEKLSVVHGPIRVKGDTLAVAGLDDNKLHLFKIN